MDPTPHFAHGQFLGRYDMRRQVGGFSFAELSPTVPAHAVETHTHDDGHYLLLLDGIYLSSARGAPALCTTPTLIYNPPGTTHRDRFRSDGGRFFTIAVSPEDAREIDAVLPAPTHASVQRAEAQVLAWRLLQVCRDWNEPAGLSAQALTLELLASTARLRSETSLQPPAWLRRAREQLHDECVHPIRIDTLARTAGVHPVHFSREFRRHYRCTPGDYLRRCRLDRAAAALTDTRAPLATVAVAAGFADAAHLGHAFRRSFGISPVAYRRLARRPSKG